MGDERAQFWRRAKAALTRIAFGWTRNESEAEDAAQQAIVDCFEASPPDEELAAFVRRAATVMRHDFLDRVKASKRRQAAPWLNSARDQQRGLRRTPEDLAATREEKARVAAILLERTKDDPDARRVAEEMLSGNDSPADQAEALQMPIETLRNARKRLARILDEIAESEGPPDQSRGWEGDGDADEPEEDLS